MRKFHHFYLWKRLFPSAKITVLITHSDWSTHTERTSCILCVLPQDLIRFGSLHFRANWFSPKNTTRVQYSRLDSSGQNLGSNGVWSKDETGSVKQYFQEGWKVVRSPSDPMETHRFRWNLEKSSRAMSQNKNAARLTLTRSLSSKPRLARLTCNVSRKVETSTRQTWHKSFFKLWVETSMLYT